MIFNLSANNTIANHFVSELRDLEIQKDKARFRKNLEKIGEILAYEISKTFQYERKAISTPLAVTSVFHLASQPVLATILRAGLPMYQGFSNFFDHAESAFIGAFRGEHQLDYTFDITLEYVAAPHLEDKNLILIDPMLATGKSILSSYASLLKYGKPSQLHVAAAIAAPEGIDLLQREIPGVSIWVGAIDEKLNSQFYIVPGLGDAGDLAFGPKVG
ncbi:MAG TPA: uracil phosphoribosyltransferase [Cytophagales bacterium]|nr:uracil phosphoribosyltransferase [Cytophagales bacterium]